MLKRTQCIPTKLLTQETYDNLITLLVSKGYRNLTANLVTVTLLQCWNYIGVDDWGDIVTYDHPYSFLKVNGWLDYPVDMKDKDYPNILTEEEINLLLGEIL